jgi:hypothetical protein
MNPEFQSGQTVIDRVGQEWKVFTQQGDLVLVFQRDPFKIGVLDANSILVQKEFVHTVDENGQHHFKEKNEEPNQAA